MLNKFKKLLLVGFILFLLCPIVVLAKNPVDIYFFYGDGCPHCAEESQFLNSLTLKYSNININSYEVWYNQQNNNLMQEMANKLNVDISGIPFTIIGEKTITGYSSSMNDQFEKLIKYYSYYDVGDYNEEIEEDFEISIPILGKINPKTFSLPLITIIMGIIDGFNPCAMWVLLFLISMLIGMKDVKRRLLLGVIFIVTSSLVYFLFMAAWLNLALLIGTLLWIRIFISLIAISGGSYNIITALTKKGDGCQIVDKKKRTKTFDRIKKIIKEKKLWLSIIGIMVVAVSVNIIELLCSAGLPVVYSQILALNELSIIQYYLYLILYILFFMIDDIIVFIIAMKTLQLKGISTKYGKISHLIGGIMMLLIGILLVFKPEWLMFG